MEKIDKFVNELKKTLDYSEEAKVINEVWVEKIHKVYICNVSMLFKNTIKIIAKWNGELYRNKEGDYVIIVEL